jgi:hypothetical protein
MLVAQIQKHTQKLGVFLGKELTTCLLLYVLCLNCQKKTPNPSRNASKFFRRED